MIRRFGVFGLIASATLVGCADLLAIPEDPYLEEPEPQPALLTPRIPDGSEAEVAPGESTNDDPAEAAAPDGNESNASEADGEGEPPGDDAESESELDRPGATALAGDDEAPMTTAAPSGGDAPAADEPAPAADEPPPAGENEAPPVTNEPAPPAPPPPACVPGRRPVDLVLIADNSMSMGTEITALENALPGFADDLEDEALDYRLILLSRLRTAGRGTSVQESTSLCVTAPLGALASCPAAAPAASARFLHYDVAVAESDSFDRLLDTYDFPDTHGLAPNGWGERLRVGALKVVIEISDGDSARPLQDFLGELSLLAPEHFGSDPAAPGFVFHSVVGVRPRAFAAAYYGPLEPLETIACGEPPTGADNAGTSYQTLSRLTGGLRFSICASNALPFVLGSIASDVSERSVLPCEP